MYSIHKDKDFKYYIFPKDFDVVKVNADNCIFIRTEKNTVVTDFSVDYDRLARLLGHTLSGKEKFCYIANGNKVSGKPLCFICQDQLRYLTKNCTIHFLPFCTKFRTENPLNFSLDLKNEVFLKPTLLNEYIGKRNVKDLHQLSFAPTVVNANRKALKDRYEFVRKQKAKTCKGCVINCKEKIPQLNCYVSKEALDRFLNKEIRTRFGSMTRLLKLLSYCHRLNNFDFENNRYRKRKTALLLPIKKDELLVLGKIPKEKSLGSYYFRQKVKRLKRRYNTFSNVETARLVMLLLYILGDNNLLNSKEKYKKKNYFSKWEYQHNYYIYNKYNGKRYVNIHFCLADTKSLWTDFYYNLGSVKEAKQKVSSYQELFRLLPKWLYLDKVLNRVNEQK